MFFVLFWYLQFIVFATIIHFTSTGHQYLCYLPQVGGTVRSEFQFLVKIYVKEERVCFFLCGLLSVACVYDYIGRRIPNYLLVIMLVTGLGGGVLKATSEMEQIIWVVHFLMVMIIVVAVFFPFYKIGTIGAGDVKLFAVCAGYFSTNQIMYFLFYSMLVSALFIFIRFAMKKDMKERFGYLVQYTTDVMKSGRLRLYIKDKEERKKCSICLAGPVLLGVLLHLGGVY